MGRARRLNRDDWIDATLKVLAEGGINAVVVPELAHRLRVTKGSFYWHFQSVDDLLEATFERWSVRDTGAAIAALDEIKNPRRRLETLLSPPVDEGISRIDLALMSSAADPRVRPWLARHNRLWLEFARRAYLDMGFPADEAANRAIHAYSAYLGAVALHLENPEQLADAERFHDYLTFLRKVLVPRGRPRGRPRHAKRRSAS